MASSGPELADRCSLCGRPPGDKEIDVGEGETDDDGIVHWGHTECKRYWDDKFVEVFGGQTSEEILAIPGHQGGHPAYPPGYPYCTSCRRVFEAGDEIRDHDCVAERWTVTMGLLKADGGEQSTVYKHRWGLVWGLCTLLAAVGTIVAGFGVLGGYVLGLLTVLGALKHVEEKNA